MFLNFLHNLWLLSRGCVSCPSLCSGEALKSSEGLGEHAWTCLGDHIVSGPFLPTFFNLHLFLKKKFHCSGCLWVRLGLHVMWSPSLSSFLPYNTHTQALQSRFLSSECIRHTQTLPNSSPPAGLLLPPQCFILRQHLFAMKS